LFSKKRRSDDLLIITFPISLDLLFQDDVIAASFLINNRLSFESGCTMEKGMKWLSGCLLILLITVGWVNKELPNDQKAQTFDAKSDPRRAKVEAICGSCHLFVEPDVLDKATWAKSVLPAMGTRLGIFSHKGVSYPCDLGKPNTKGVFPEKPLLSKKEWQNILDYYSTYAPRTVEKQVRTETYSLGLPLFKAQAVIGNKEPPVVSLVKVLADNRFCFYDVSAKKLAMIGRDGKSLAQGVFQNPLSCMVPYKKGFILSMIGSLYPSDEWKGTLSYVEILGDRFVEKEVIQQKVERPVQIQTGDLDGDGVEDILVCGFGNNKGSFHWLKKLGSKWQKKSIKSVPGAIRTQLVDIDKDGDLDVITLFAQGLEKLILFTNDGFGNFSERNLLEFLPVQGSSYFEMRDFNKDGNLDILYTCGDNADYSVVLKKYHGVYIYLGDSNGKFTQHYFFPMHGAYKAMAEDFDGDGDLDIAAISFFADYDHQPNEGFLFFEQKNRLEFEVRTNKETEHGRWLTLDVGDVDGDQDPDIVLGNFSIGPTNASDPVVYKWQTGPVTLTLKNNSKH